MSETEPNSEQLNRSRAPNRTAHAWIAPAGGRAVAGSNPVSPITESPAKRRILPLGGDTGTGNKRDPNSTGIGVGPGAEFGSSAWSEGSDAQVEGLRQCVAPGPEPGGRGPALRAGSPVRRRRRLRSPVSRAGKQSHPPLDRRLGEIPVAEHQAGRASPGIAVEREAFDAHPVAGGSGEQARLVDVGRQLDQRIQPVGPAARAPVRELTRERVEERRRDAGRSAGACAVGGARARRGR